MTVSRVLVVTGGHPFEAEPFFAIFDHLPGIEWTGATAPELGHDVVVFYDMPGLEFTGGDPPVVFPPPGPERIATIEALQDAGTGLVFMHHAVAGWPSWNDYAEIVGGRFHYQPASLRGRHYPDSGYVFDVTHEVTVIEPGHPVCHDVPSSFAITDELYCFPVFEDSVVPLMRTSFAVGDDSNFFSADRAIRGRRNSRDGWTHPPGSDLVAWAKTAGRSPVVYLQFGDGPTTYHDPVFRRILANSIDWVASPAAREWVRSRSSSE